MPVGPFATFDACVSANQDKRSPGGFCASLEEQSKKGTKATGPLDNIRIKTFTPSQSFLAQRQFWEQVLRDIKKRR